MFSYYYYYCYCYCWIVIANTVSIARVTQAQAQAQATRTTFRRLDLVDIYNEMDNLQTLFPDFVTVTSTQDEFNLPSSCKFYSNQQQQNADDAGCSNRYIVLEDPIIYSHPWNGKKALRQRPDVFLSGSLHGDERVGPVAMVEVAKLLALAATCEADWDNLSLLSSSSSAPSATTAIATLEKECDTFYTKYTKQQSSWFARLVSTRRIIIFPAANSNGYHLNTRYEPYYTQSSIQYLDPNRDFAFDNTSSRNCMRTITARSINELFQRYLFQMSMTYHGGVENITFEWGAKSVQVGKLSPDDVAQRMLVEKMSLYAGELHGNPNSVGADYVDLQDEKKEEEGSGKGYSSNNNENNKKVYSNANKYYETGDINTVLYGVHGGFEDWAYAGSWATDLMRVCTPQTYDGYDVSKTTYDSATLATFNVLVEISNDKDPPSNQYGSDVNMLKPPFTYDGNVNNGYATKHIRTALMAIDVVEPYVQIFRVKKRFFYNDYKPLRQLQYRWCTKTNGRRVRIKKKNLLQGQDRGLALGQKRSRGINIFWNVGGSFSAETFLLYGRWTDFPYVMNCINQVDHDIFIPILESATVVGGTNSSNSTLFKTPIQRNGQTRWSEPNFDPNPYFSTRKVDLSNFNVGDKLAVFAVAKVDQNWKDAVGGGRTSIWPENVRGQQQSHMVNGRTNPDYYKEKLGREVQGRKYWISVPITLVVR